MDFIKATELGELPPGETQLVSIDGRRVLLCRVGEDVYAIGNTCLHLARPLADGTLEDSTLTCPWHGWSYDVTTGQACHDRRLALRRYAVRLEGDDVLVSTTPLPRHAAGEQL